MPARSLPLGNWQRQGRRASRSWGLCQGRLCKASSTHPPHGLYSRSPHQGRLALQGCKRRASERHRASVWLLYDSGCVSAHPPRRPLATDSLSLISTTAVLSGAAGAFLLFIAIFIALPVIVLSPTKFAMSFTLGNGLLVSGLAVLKGWRVQLAAMTAPDRRAFTAGTSPVPMLARTQEPCARSEMSRTTRRVRGQRARNSLGSGVASLVSAVNPVQRRASGGAGLLRGLISAGRRCWSDGHQFRRGHCGGVSHGVCPPEPGLLLGRRAQAVAVGKACLLYRMAGGGRVYAVLSSSRREEAPR